jgi:hypothetical protein
MNYFELERKLRDANYEMVKARAKYEHSDRKDAALKKSIDEATKKFEELYAIMRAVVDF